MPSTPVAIGEVFANKYRVDKVLGEGGMGIVVAAHHLELDQPVAIKFLLDDVASQDEGAERFRREARAAAKIQSDHVVRVLDVGVLDSGARYMVMEYLEGHDLSEELAQRQTFPVGVAAGFILEAIDAVGRAHAVGIVHRDLKPANLFLARREDGTQRIKVLDFGISKSIGSATSEEMSLTKTSAWIGSPLYMAPEQMQSARDVDHRADIWSLGAILYELISGRPPYIAESLPQLCSLLLTTDPEPLLKHCPACPVGLAGAVMQCLERDPTKRTQSTGELAHALAQYATSVTGSGFRQSLLDRTEMQTSAPQSLQYRPSSTQGAVPSAISGSTHAAWGATDENTRPKSNGKIGLAVLALLAAGVVGFLLMRREPAVVETEPPTAATQAPEASEKPESAAVEPEEPAREVIAASATPPQAPEPAPVPEATARPSAAPQRPLPAARPAPQPRPTPRPQASPKPSDDFSDFGGRR